MEALLATLVGGILGGLLYALIIGTEKRRKDK